MESYCKLYINKLVDSLKSNINVRADNVIFIKHYNTLDISKEDIQSNIEDDDTLHLLYYEYSSGEMNQPYAPFLDWIKQLYDELYQQKLPIDSFLEMCQVYPLHRSVLRSYIKGKKCERKEDVIVIEVEYEQIRFLQSLYNIITYISQEKSIFMILNKLHLAGSSTVAFLRRFLKNGVPENIAIMTTYNEIFPINSYMQAEWKKLINYVEEKNIVFDWGFVDTQKTSDVQEVFSLTMGKMEEYIQKIENMLHTLALEEAAYYLQIIYLRIEREKFSVTIDQKVVIFLIYGLISIYRGELDRTLLLCEGILSLNVLQDNATMHFRYNYLIGLAQVYMAQFPLAKVYAEECKKIALKIKDDFLYFKAELLDYIAKFRGWKNIFLCDFFFQIEDQFIERAEKYGYKNHLAYTYVYGYDNDFSVIPKAICGEEMLEYFQKGIAIGQELNNYNFLIVAYKKCVTFFEGFGRHEHVGYYYNRCIELLQIEENKIEEGNIYNGLGYNSAVSEQFVKANDYFNYAIQIMYEEELTENVAETLYNMATNCILAEEYNKGFEYLLTTIKIIEVLDIHILRVCNISKIYGLAALCNYHLGVEYNCYLYLNKMVRIIYHLLYPEGEPEYYLWDDDLFLYYFVSALLSKNNHQLEEAQDFMERAAKHMYRSKGNLFFTLPMWSLQQAKLFRLRGKEEEAGEVLEMGIDFCDEKGYHYRARTLRLEMDQRTELPKHWNLSLKNLNQKMIIDLARHASVEAELSNKEKDINFLSAWQEMLNNEDYNLELLYQNALSTIQNTFSFDMVFYFRMQDGKILLEFQTIGKELSKKEMSIIAKFFQKQRRSFLVNRIEKGFDDYEELLSIFGKNKVVTLVGVPHMENDKIHSIMLGIVMMHRNFTSHRILLNEGNLTIIRFAFGQLIEAVERLKAREERQRMNEELQNMNERLQEIAIKDLLTGLYNRQGFKHIIESCEEAGYVGKTSAIMYIDLDNFKYYNDSFGHDIGDLVLISFANIFKKIVKDMGFAVRYGGDEFILFFKGKSIEYTKRMAEKIYDTIADGFKETIERKLKETIKIPENRIISCSIGIAKVNQYTLEDIYTAISQADEALYYIKRTTKNSYMVWDDIPEAEKKNKK